MVTMRLSDQAALMTAGRLVERVVGIVSGIVLVRLLTKDDYGTFLQVSLIGGMCAYIVLLGLPQSLSFFLPGEESARKKRFIAQTAVLIGGLALLSALVLAVGGRWVGLAMHNRDLAEMSLLLGAYTLVYALDRMVEPTLIALGEARRAGLLAAFSSLLLLAATLVPAWLGHGVEWIYVCIVLVYFARLLYFARHVAGMEGAMERPVLQRPSLRKQLDFSVPLGLAGLSGLYNRQLDGLIVAFFFIPSIYAVYARGAFELPLIDLLPYTLATVILPRLVELWSARKREEFAALWNRSILISSLFVFPAFVYAFLFAQDLMVLLFTEAYRDSVPVFQVYLLGLPFRLTSYGVILQAIGDTRTILWSSLWGLVFNAALAIMLCPTVGPIGAAIGYLGSQLFQIVYLLNVIRRRTGLPLSGLMPWRKLAYGLATVGASGLVVRLLAGRLSAAPVRLLVAGTLLVILCTVGFRFVGLLGSDESALVKRWGRILLGPYARWLGPEDTGERRPEGLLP